jgi:hypothetical protein
MCVTGDNPTAVNKYIISNSILFKQAKKVLNRPCKTVDRHHAVSNFRMKHENGGERFLQNNGIYIVLAGVPGVAQDEKM